MGALVGFAHRSTHREIGNAPYHAAKGEHRRTAVRYSRRWRERVGWLEQAIPHMIDGVSPGGDLAMSAHLLPTKDGLTH